MYSRVIRKGHGEHRPTIQEGGVVMRSEGACVVSNSLLSEGVIISPTQRITKLLLILLLVSLSHCSTATLDILNVNGWPCPNVNGFNTPEQSCQRDNVRID